MSYFYIDEDTILIDRNLLIAEVYDDIEEFDKISDMISNKIKINKKFIDSVGKEKSSKCSFYIEFFEDQDKFGNFAFIALKMDFDGNETDFYYQFDSLSVSVSEDFEEIWIHNCPYSVIMYEWKAKKVIAFDKCSNGNTNPKDFRNSGFSNFECDSLETIVMEILSEKPSILVEEQEES